MITTRRHFIGKCAAGLALAPAARLLAQSNGLAFGSFVMTSSRVTLLPGYVMTYKVSFKGAQVYQGTFLGTDMGVARTTELSIPISPASAGQWDVMIEAGKQGGAPVWNLQAPNMSANYKNEYVATTGGVGRFLRFGVVTSTAVHSPSPGTTYNSFKLNFYSW